MNASELYREGKLTEAIELTQQAVKRQPTDTGQRMTLCELLLFAGQWERADKQLEVMALQTPAMGVTVALLRQLIRGEMARQQFHSEGRAPSLLTDDEPVIRRHLQASVALRDGQTAEAVRLLEQSQELTAALSGTCNEQPFVGLRDLDDLLGPILEAITPNGKYYWIPLEAVDSLEFYPPEQMVDLLWRRATASIHNGPQGDIYIPVLYAGSHEHDDPQICLGRKTDWSVEMPVRGRGQRELLIGEDAIPILELKQLQVTRPS